MLAIDAHRETLTLIAPCLGDGAEARIEPKLYAAAAAALLEELNEVPNEVDSVMLIGHNPGIQDLALSLARDGPDIARVRRSFRPQRWHARVQSELARVGAREAPSWCRL